MNQIKAVIFDLDGTLVYTNWGYRFTLLKNTLDTLGGELKDPLYVNKFWFESGRNKFIVDNFKVDPELFWREFIKQDLPQRRLKHTKPFTDIDFIGELKQGGYKTGIVTNSSNEIAYAEIKLIGKENFDDVIIANNFLNRILPKPHPEGLERCMNSLNVNKSQSIYVGNSEEDIIAAENAGVFGVLIKRGEYEFPNLNPPMTISSLYELRDYFD